MRCLQIMKTNIHKQDFHDQTLIEMYSYVIKTVLFLYKLGQKKKPLYIFIVKYVM